MTDNEGLWAKAAKAGSLLFDPVNAAPFVSAVQSVAGPVQRGAEGLMSSLGPRKEDIA